MMRGGFTAERSPLGQAILPTGEMAGAHVLCEVEYVREPNPSGGSFARLKPLAVEREGSWLAVPTPRISFPDEGLVYWWSPPATVRIGALWRVTVIPQPKYDGQKRPDRYQVREGSGYIVDECLSAAGVTTEDSLHVVFEPGVELELAPSGRVFLRLSGDSIAGPLDLVEHEGRWRCPKAEMRSKVPVRDVEASLLHQVETSGQRLRTVLKPNVAIPPASKYINVQSPYDLLHSLLKRVRNLDQKTFEALGTTFAVYEGFLEALRKAELLPDQRAVEDARSERVRPLLEQMQLEAETLKEVTEALTARPEVQSRIERAVGEEVEIRLRLEQKRIDEECATRRKALSELDGQLVKANQKLEEVTKRITRAEEEASAKAAELEAALTSRLRQILENPVAELADHVLLRNLLARPGSLQAVTVAPPASNESLPWPSPGPNTNSPLLGEFSVVCAALSRRATSLGASMMAARAGLGSCLAGALPVFVGGGVLDLVQSLADTVAGGRLMTIAVPSTTAGLIDLCGAFDGSGRFYECPGSLLSALSTARASSQPVVIYLEGINRAPVESYLPQLLSSLAGVGSGARQAAFAIPGASGSGSWARWPDNALLVASVFDGPSTFALPRDVLDYLVLIPTSLGNSLGVVASEAAGEVTEVNSETWLRVRATAADELQIAACADELPRIEHLSRPRMARLIQGFKAVGIPEPDAVQLALACRGRLVEPRQTPTPLTPPTHLQRPPSEESWLTKGTEHLGKFIYGGKVGGVGND